MQQEELLVITGQCASVYKGIETKYNLLDFIARNDVQNTVLKFDH